MGLRGLPHHRCLRVARERAGTTGWSSRRSAEGMVALAQAGDRQREHPPGPRRQSQPSKTRRRRARSSSPARCFHSQSGKRSTLFTPADRPFAEAHIAGARSVNLEMQDGRYEHAGGLETPDLLRVYQKILPDGRKKPSRYASSGQGSFGKANANSASPARDRHVLAPVHREADRGGVNRGAELDVPQVAAAGPHRAR